MSDKIVGLDIGRLAEPLTKLVEVVSAGIGTLYEPTRTRRQARADADAALVIARSALQISDLERRAAQRILAHETRRQANIEAIAELAETALPTEVSQEPVDMAWSVQFFDQCKDVSNEEMRHLWARVLAGEVSSPGSFQLRTLAILRTLTQAEAQLLTRLGSFAWTLDDAPTVIVPRKASDQFRDYDLVFDELLLLQEAGMITMQNGISMMFQARTIRASYFDSHYELLLPKNKFELDIGHVATTTAGDELLSICSSSAIPTYRDSSIERMASHKIKVLPLQSGI